MPLARSSNIWRSGRPRRREVRNRLKERAVFQNLKRGDATRCGFAEDTIPAGLAVVLPSGENRYQSLNLQVLNIPFITGVAVQVNWRDIEPTQGAPDSSKLDELFAAAESANKWVQLAIFPAFFSPAWALEGTQTERNFAGSRVL